MKDLSEERRVGAESKTQERLNKQKQISQPLGIRSFRELLRFGKQIQLSPKSHVIPNAFIAAVIGSEKNTGSTRSTMSPETSRKFRLFSSGMSALRAPLSIATCSGSARDRIGLMFPWIL